ncbi:MAG TPA: PilZ domain-containing protein [Cellvibrionaceae bacterium]
MLFQALAQKLKLTASPANNALQEPAKTQAKTDIATGDYTALEQLQQQRQQLEVGIEGSRNHYQSMILAIDSARGLLWIDELFPQSAALEPGRWLTLRHHRNGEVLTLRSPLVANGEHFNTRGLALLLPESLNYLPRRENPRHELRHYALPVSIRPMGEGYCQGTLINLSLGGMHLALPGNHLGHIRRDTLLPDCEFTLGNGKKIRCTATVKSTRLIRTPYRHTQVSLAFADNMPDRAALQQHLQQLEQCYRHQAA